MSAKELEGHGKGYQVFPETETNRLKNQKQPFISVFVKSVLKISSKFTGKQPRRSAISIKLQSIFIQFTVQHGCSPVNLLHIFRTFCPSISGGPLLKTFSGNSSVFDKKYFSETIKTIARLEDLTVSYQQLKRGRQMGILCKTPLQFGWIWWKVWPCHL